MTKKINYEVQVQQNGRWSIHARFPESQKDDAIEEGKQLDKLSAIDSVKVIKEVYDPHREKYNEYIVYKSPSMKSRTGKDYADSKSSGHGSTQNRDDSWLGGSEDSDEAGSGRGRSRSGGLKKGQMKKKTTTLTAVIVKLLMVILFSLCLAALFAVMASEILGGTNLFGLKIVGNAESNLLIGVFILTFLTSATGMTVTIMRGQNLETSRRPGFLARQAKLAKQAQEAAAKKPPPKNPKAGLSTAAGPSAQVMEEVSASTNETMKNLDEAMKGVGEIKTVEETGETPETQAAKAAEDAAVTERLQAELNKDKKEEKEPGAEEQTARGVVLDASTQPEPGSDVLALSPNEEKQKTFMMNFLSQALVSPQDDKKKLDNFNKFGVNLYLAGACEILAQKREVTPRALSKILADGVQVMGFKKSHAASFADRYEEYLMADSRYMQMFQSGRNAMNTHLTDENAAPKLLETALEEWNKPKPKEEQTGPITVMFTDIAGSTAMTQALGDAGAQKVVRAHNLIVREALSAHAGREVKHTGDGIMASFNKTSDGVDASIRIQRETALHNQVQPDLPLHLKIGLNSGEPIAEDNDLFGTMVQLSARIVDKASADEIFVSEIVRGICAGKNYKFSNRGGYEMKGFGDDVTLFEVIWNETDEETSDTPPPLPAVAEAAAKSAE
ncbi:MAG: adenylate/guanylate cyclase domain-containing protein [Proteobacteria bacterium]|nr:adenylate/guanylate cyclase domain-containing protein [Pseudomonadota bacterium]